MKRRATWKKSFSGDEGDFHGAVLAEHQKQRHRKHKRTLNAPDLNLRIACPKMQINTFPPFKVCHPPEFDFVQHTFGFVMGHTYQRLLINGYELIPGSQTPILKKKGRAADVISKIVYTADESMSARPRKHLKDHWNSSVA